MKDERVINRADLYEARHKPSMDREVLKAAVALTIGAVLIYAIVFMVFIF